MRQLYGLLTTLLTPVLLASLLWKSRQQPGYRKALKQRLALGLTPLGSPGAVRLWIHAVSVGETLAIAPLVELLLTNRPDVSVLITSTTPTGAEQVERLFGNRVDRAWLPVDSRGAVRRALDHWQPSALALVETEIWPELIRQCKERGVTTLLMNARLSARSLRGYLRLGRIMSDTVADFDHIACQNHSDARRFRYLGASPGRVSTVGSLKFNIDGNALHRRCALLSETLDEHLKSRPVLLAASTHPGEEKQVLDALQTARVRHPDLMLWLAPRHPHRSEGLLRKAREAGLSVASRSTGRNVGKKTDVLLIDTMGELAAFMGLATAVFMGGSLVPHGGHNPLEALVFGKPVLSGHHTGNFKSLYRALDRGNLVLRVDNSDTLVGAIDQALSPGVQQHYAITGPEFVQRNQGALQAQYALLNTALPQ